MEQLTLIIEPTGYNNRGQLFDAWLYAPSLGTTHVLANSTQPLLDACRNLLAGGKWGPETPIAMRHKGSDADALKTTVGYAAKLSVQETKAGSPRFTPWMPFNPRESLGAGSDIPAQNEIQAAE